MAVMISKAKEALELELQKIPHTCQTRKRRLRSIGLVYLCILMVGILAAVWSYYHFQPTALTHPDFDPNAVTGTPQVDEKYGYSTLTLEDSYLVCLCGVPANDGQTVEFYLTNPAESQVWFRAEILDEQGNQIGSTGVLRPGEYLPSITLTRPLTQRETPVTVRIVAYEPDTWQSRGNVNLNMTLYLEYS